MLIHAPKDPANRCFETGMSWDTFFSAELGRVHKNLFCKYTYDNEPQKYDDVSVKMPPLADFFFGRMKNHK